MRDRKEANNGYQLRNESRPIPASALRPFVHERVLRALGQLRQVPRDPVAL